MKILLLVIIVTWSFGGEYQNTPEYKIVSSAEEAAIMVYNDRPSKFDVEPDQKRYALYEIEIGNMVRIVDSDPKGQDQLIVARKIEIPELSFRGD